MLGSGTAMFFSGILFLLSQRLSSQCGHISPLRQSSILPFDAQHSLSQGANQQEYVTPGTWDYSTSFDWSQEVTNRNQSPCYPYGPGMWPNNYPNASEPSLQVTHMEQPLPSQATWSEEGCSERVDPSWDWPHREPLANPNCQRDGKYSYPNWHHDTGGLSDQLCDKHHLPLNSTAAQK